MKFRIFVIDFQMITRKIKDSPVVISDMEMLFFRTLNERDRRRFLACEATGPMKVAVKRLATILKVGKNTIYKGIRELIENISPGEGRIRRSGGGAKNKISQHPEWMEAFRDIVSHHMAGLPQDEGTENFVTAKKPILATPLLVPCWSLADLLLICC